MVKFQTGMLIGMVMFSALVGATEPDMPTSRAALEDYLNQQAFSQLEARQTQMKKITTVAQAETRKAEVKAKIIALIGKPQHGVPLRAKVTGQTQGAGFYVENVHYDAQPRRRVTANLFLPANGNGPFPAIILSPGHGPSGKLTNYTFAANLARNGFVALAYDIVGEGERMEYFDPATGRSRGERPTGDHSIAAFPAILTGEHVARYFIEDAMQGIDYLLSRPEVAARRIGAFGCSGGGTVTAYVAALDERVQAAATACYVTDFGHLLATAGPQEAEQSIHNFIANGLDITDWLEQAAPKPYLVISTTEDMFPYAGAIAAVAEARAFWQIYSAGDKFEWLSGSGGHGAIAPLADQIIDFFRRSLNLDGQVVPYVGLRPERPQELLVTSTGQLITSIGTITLADIQRERVMAIKPDVSPSADTVRKAIIELANVQTKSSDVAKVEFVGVQIQGELKSSTYRLMSDKGSLDLLMLQGVGSVNNQVMLLLSPDSVINLANDCPAVTDLVRKQWTVIAVQARGMDGDGQAKSEFVGNQNLLALRAMLVGKTLPGIRIEDTIALIDWIDTELHPGSVTLMGLGVMGPVALQAALFDQRINTVVVERSPVSLRSAVALPIARDLPANTIPAMLMHYDLPDVINALAPRKVVVAAPVDPLGVVLNQSAFYALVPKASHLNYQSEAQLSCNW